MKNYQILLLLIIINFSKTVKVGEIVKLPDPIKEGGMPLYEALNQRKSSRDFDDSKKLNTEIISQALWCSYGINRPTKFKTVPSAKGWYPLLVYVFLEEGVFQYSAKDHHLLKILEGDYRAMTGTQTSVVTSARANFVFIADFKKKSAMDGDDAHKLRSIYLDTGHVAMALSLFAASNNMKGVDRAMVDADPLLDLLQLNKEDYIFTLAFSLGY